MPYRMLVQVGTKAGETGCEECVTARPLSMPPATPAQRQPPCASELPQPLQESAEALHGLTLRKQIQLQASRVQAEPAHSPAHPAASAPSSATAAAAAAPTPLPAVHVRPSPHASRPQRLFLVGRVRLDFTTSTSCFYGSHDVDTYCDYCTPSAAIKALLRLMAASPLPSPSLPPLPPLPPPAHGASLGGLATSSVSSLYGGGSALGGGSGAGGSAAGEVCRRFAASGGLYGLLLLLHHEAAGVHHSKLAASLLTLLDLVLEHDPAAQVGHVCISKCELAGFPCVFGCMRAGHGAGARPGRAGGV